MQRRMFIAGAAGAAMLTGLISNVRAQTAKLFALRTWTSQEYTRVTLEFDGVMLVDQQNTQAATFDLLQTPQGSSTVSPMYSVDLLGLVYDTAVKEKFSTLPIGGFFQTIQVLPTVSGTRLQITLTPGSELDATVVAPTSQYKQRLLLDAFASAVDPIAIWLAQKNVQSNANQLAIVQPNKTSKKVLVIDAGHGGEDPGAIGPTGVQEKNITLSLAKQLAQSLKNSKRWEPVLTRDADFFVPLEQRVKKARAVKADLLLSLHADAFYTPKARGASVYVWSDKSASSATAKWLAQKENAADLVGGLNMRHRDKQLTEVLLDMSTTSQIKRSKTVASQLLKHISEIAIMHKPNIEQAGFAVLKAPDVPSILVETAFISNPEEEQLLNSQAYQTKLVAALVKTLHA